MSRRLTMVAAALFLAAAAHAQDVSRLGWMAGHWVQRSANEEVQESWLGPRGNTMVATNLTMRAGRGASFEFLRIAVKDGTLVYFAMPNGRPPTEFAMRSIGDESVTFENPANPYPARIIYRRDGDAMVARVEGVRQGKESFEEWRFNRAP